MEILTDAINNKYAGLILASAVYVGFRLICAQQLYINWSAVRIIATVTGSLASFTGVMVYSLIQLGV